MNCGEMVVSQIVIEVGTEEKGIRLRHKASSYKDAPRVTRGVLNSEKRS